MATYEQFERQSIETLQETHDTFGRTKILSSFGTESAVLLHLVRKARLPLQVLTIDTGFLFPQTKVHQRQLEQVEAFRAVKYGVTGDEVADITRRHLWATGKPEDKAEYHRRTKLEPLSLAIEELGIQALITGVRRSQTENREELDTYQTGRDGELRINPLLNWTDEAVEDYTVDEKLLRHPLHYQGYGSVGDWTLTTPGNGREGRNLGAASECGLHLFAGKLVDAGSIV